MPHTLINLPACGRIFGKCRPDILPPSVGPGAGSAPVRAKFTCTEKEVDIPYRLMDSAAGRNTFGFPTKTAPSHGSYGSVWFACFCPLCPCAANGFACRNAGTASCNQPSRCTCCVTIASKIKKTGMEELTIRGFVQRQGLAGGLSASDMPALDGSDISLAWPPHWRPSPPPALNVPGTEDTLARRAQVPETPTGQPPPPASTPPPPIRMSGRGWGGCA